VGGEECIYAMSTETSAATAAATDLGRGIARGRTREALSSKTAVSDDAYRLV